MVLFILSVSKKKYYFLLYFSNFIVFSLNYQDLRTIYTNNISQSPDQGYFWNNKSRNVL